ncbi:hypothetical protein [Sphingomonas sp. URHD0057]|uniref:hypothetical protein n=1 Tax=Sphingomonas sp. URHD0057 TaxID=1380389 RepID=UPI000491F8FD|nr:hypothetical protein [Sphingomonas sp. URHD0057]
MPAVGDEEGSEIGHGQPLPSTPPLPNPSPAEERGILVAVISYEVDEVDAIDRARGFADAAGKCGFVDKVIELEVERFNRFVGIDLAVAVYDRLGYPSRARWRVVTPRDRGPERAISKALETLETPPRSSKGRRGQTMLLPTKGQSRHVSQTLIGKVR